MHSALKGPISKVSEGKGRERGKSTVSELQCQFQGMSPVVYAPRMKVIHALSGTFPVTEKVIYTFLYYVIDNRRYI